MAFPTSCAAPSSAIFFQPSGMSAPIERSDQPGFDHSVDQPFAEQIGRQAQHVEGHYAAGSVRP